MDRNQVIGFALIFLILVGWSILNTPTPEEIQQAKEKERLALEDAQQPEPIAEATVSETPSAPTMEPTRITDSSQFGIFAGAATGTEETVILENDLVEMAFSTKGGIIKYVELSKYDKILSEPGKEQIKTKVRLFEDERNKFNYQLTLVDRIINTQDLFFTARKSGNSVVFRANTLEGGYIEQKYTLHPNRYYLDYTVTIQGLQSQMSRDQALALEIVNHLDAIEQNVQFEKRFSTVYFKEKDEDSDYCSCTGDDTEELPGSPIEWVSFANQFFNTSVIAGDQPFQGLVATTEMAGEDQPDLKKTTANLQFAYGGSASETYNMGLYLGPNEYKRLKAFDNDLVEIIPFGRSIFGDINRLFIRPFFDWLSQFISSKGIVIIVLIFIIKMALYPLTYKMLHSQAKMGALKPQLAGLKEKYKDDAQKTQMETMKVYREYGVSPFGGCMPMIAQIPIWYALFRFFPASITFRQEPFLWAQDLSSYDVLVNLPFVIPAFGGHISLFTVLWAISTVIYTYYNSKHMDMSANPAMKYVQYLMPVMFFVFFNNYASGLTCYMLFSNLFNIAQTVVTKKFVFNEEKILAELNIQKSKPKKKSSFQAKLAEAMEKQQKIQAQKETQKKKKSRK